MNRIERNTRLPLALLMAPLVLFLLVFYALPLFSMLSRSVVSEQGPTFTVFANLFVDSAFWRVLGISATVGLVTTVLCLLLAYPLAYFMARLEQGTANVLFVLVLVPFWTSILVRTYAWMVLLGRRGLINDALIGLGAIERPLQLLNSRSAVYIAMVHVLLPFMVLPLYSALRSLDWRLVMAARSLGAGSATTFLKIILPLSMPGVATGCLLVFTLAIGFYITPALLGGPNDMMISMLIETKIRQFDWPTAAAMAVVLLACVLAVVALFARFVSINAVVRR
jgi:putative spermidine/putrescine transport system permease protein